LQVLLFLTVLLYTILFEKFGFLLFLIIFDTFICQSSRINLFSRNLLLFPLFLWGKVTFKSFDFL